MDQLIPLMSKVYDILGTVNLDEGANVDSSFRLSLPQIVVVGSQSVGKSSVLEAIVGRDFLPRGSGIVTRTPLILMLNYLNCVKDYARFNHSGDKIFYDFEEVRQEIERETDRLTGGKMGKVISRVPITLKIYSKQLIDLTLVDLPGITKVPVGNQPSNIEDILKELILEYIRNPNCIILAVSAANTDIANSDSLQLSREVDLNGDRTIGVITKCDLVDVGTDVLDLLVGKVYALKRGYVGVVCRNQKEINENKPIGAALGSETMFFKKHPVYSCIANRTGIPYLSKLLNNLLVERIRTCVPELKQILTSKLNTLDAEMQTYGDPVTESKSTRSAFLLHLFSRFARNFQESIDGTLPSSHAAAQLTGGARLNYIFHDWFVQSLMDYYPLQDLSDHEIRTAIRNCTGPKAALFVPEAAFELLVKRQIVKLEAPSHQCVEQVYYELLNITENCEVTEMKRFQNLRSRVMEVVRGVLKKCLSPANQMVQNIIQLELAYINTNHPDFMSDATCIADPSCFGQTASPDKMGIKPTENVLNIQNGSFLQGATALNVSKPQNLSAYSAPQGTVLKFRANSENKCGTETNENNPNVIQSGWFSKFLRSTKSSTENSSKLEQHRRSSTPNEALSLDATIATDGLSVSCIQSPYRSLATPAPGIRLSPVPDIVSPSENPTEREIIETQLIKALICSYFCIVRKTVADVVPKAIMYFMVNASKEVIQRELVSQLYREELFGDLLTEMNGVVERRKHCKQLRKVLQEAAELLCQIDEPAVHEVWKVT